MHSSFIRALNNYFLALQLDIYFSTCFSIKFSGLDCFFTRCLMVIYGFHSQSVSDLSVPYSCLHRHFEGFVPSKFSLVIFNFKPCILSYLKMLVFPNLQRGLSAFLMLCLSALLFFDPGLFSHSKDGLVKDVVERQPHEDIRGYKVSIEYLKNTAVPLSNQSFALNFSLIIQHRELRKRAFDFSYYVCKGGNQWKKLQEASEHTSSSGPVFSDDDLQDGWSKDDTEQKQIMSWIEPLQELMGRKPLRSDAKYIKLRQDKAFHNAAGDLVQVSTHTGGVDNY